MSTEKTVTENDLVAALRRARTAAPADEFSDAGLTSAELRMLTGLPEGRVRDKLKELRAEGKLAVGRRLSMNLSGVWVKVPVYNLIAEG